MDADLLALTAISAGAGGFMGAFGFWLISRVASWWSKPCLLIEYGEGYPFRDTALFQNGEKGDFIRVRILNQGRTTAKECKCYVRHIVLHSGGRSTNLPSEELMLTSWVPREANTTIMHIPPGLGFLADVAYTMVVGGEFKVVPVFNVQNQNVSEIFDHVGEFRVQVVVTAENAETVQKEIGFGFTGYSIDLLPLPRPPR